MQLSKGIFDVFHCENAPLHLPRQESQPFLSSLAGKTTPSTAAMSEFSSVTTYASGSLPTE